MGVIMELSRNHKSIIISQFRNKTKAKKQNKKHNMELTFKLAIMDGESVKLWEGSENNICCENWKISREK